MTAPRRWFRVDVTWSSSAWLVVLRPGARLGWIELLGYVKSHGVGGRVKALPPEAAAKRWGIPVRDVQQMLEAAVQNGALRVTDDGDWVITGWQKYQETDNTAAERMKRHRERKAGNTDRSAPLRRNSRNVRRNPSRDSDVDLDRDRDRTAGEHARASSASPSVNGGTPDFDGYQPTEAQRTRAAELQVDLGATLRKWRAKRKANGAHPVDLVADFDGWLEDEPGFKPTPNGSGGHAPSDTGIVRRFDPAPPDVGPEPSPEERRAGMEIVKQAVAASRAMPPVGSTIEDPDVIAAREERRLRGLAAIRPETKP